jgi:hypothetical protein
MLVLIDDLGAALTAKFDVDDAERTFRPLRAKDTNGPTPADPAGWCSGRRGVAAMPGVLGGLEPKISVWMRLAATPQFPSSTARSFMKADGPHR